jgi:hypothetical protein
MSFYGFFKKFKFSLKIHRRYTTVLPKIISLRQKLTETQNLMGLAFSFTKKRLFVMKTGWKSVFQPHKSGIMFR